jgi:Pretoxin HINT domain/HYD1 signature containing ADP-ribosyltransferase
MPHEWSKLGSDSIWNQPIAGDPRAAIALRISRENERRKDPVGYAQREAQMQAEMEQKFEREFAKLRMATKTKTKDENKPCFTADTLVDTPKGKRAIQSIRPGDLVITKHESSSDNRLETQIVEEVFEGHGFVFRIEVPGGVIETTANHPFFTRQGWLPADQLQHDDEISTASGWVRIIGTAQTDEWKTLYNFRVANCHTYFVGCDEWGFSVWAHNTCLVHYTDAAGLAGILASKTIFASTGVVNARYGDGQYFTDIMPIQVTGRKAADISDAEKAAGIISIYQLAQRLYGMPWKAPSVQYYVIVDLDGLTVSADAPHVFHVPNTTALDVSKRIVSSGKTVP